MLFLFQIICFSLILSSRLASVRVERQQLNCQTVTSIASKLFLCQLWSCQMGVSGRCLYVVTLTVQMSWNVISKNFENDFGRLRCPKLTSLSLMIYVCLSSWASWCCLWKRCWGVPEASCAARLLCISSLSRLMKRLPIPHRDSRVLFFCWQLSAVFPILLALSSMMVRPMLCL